MVICSRQIAGIAILQSSRLTPTSSGRRNAALLIGGILGLFQHSCVYQLHLGGLSPPLLTVLQDDVQSLIAAAR